MGHAEMPLEQVAQLARVPRRRLDGLDELAVEPSLEHVDAADDERAPARHAGGEVAADLTEHDDGAVRHVLAAVGADSLDDGDRSGVPDREPLARAPGAVELAARRAVQDGVPEQVRRSDRVRRRDDDDAPAAHALADAVVRLALQIELDAGREECAEALAGRAAEARANAARRGTRAEAGRDGSAEAG